MIRWIRRILGRESRHAQTVSRAQRTNEMLTALNGRRRDVERQTRHIHRTSDPITRAYGGQKPQDGSQL